MALPVLDGNQTATTLSSVVTGGEHIVAHSVVSLGANAIANITSAVSGVAISGTVTANVDNQLLTEAFNYYGTNWSEPIPVSIVEGSSSITVPISGTVTANVGIASEADVTQFGEWIANGFNAAQPTIAVLGTSGGQPFPISGTVTVGNVEGWGIPLHDYRSFSYSGGNLSTIAYKTGGASGTTVGILTLAYDGSGNLTSMTRT